MICFSGFSKHQQMEISLYPHPMSLSKEGESLLFYSLALIFVRLGLTNPSHAPPDLSIVRLNSPKLAGAERMIKIKAIYSMIQRVTAC
ncbi:hypothetical protein QUF80_12830 [Desulfococcaceae bacterium HSG8]|nr:hypothetical protein [Desulfococcaceae bacterium HSG8]